MCGRFAQFDAPRLLAKSLGVPKLTTKQTPPPRYNLAPSQPALAIRITPNHNHPAPTLTLLRWGLIPPWAKDPAIANRMINARAETAHTKPAYRAAFARRRCIIPADGFYEWAPTPGRNKQPHYIHHRDNQPLAFAALWESWQPPATDANTLFPDPPNHQPDYQITYQNTPPDNPPPPILTFTILTTQAAPALRHIHDRMPVILPESACHTWLNPNLHDATALHTLTQSPPTDPLADHPVSTLVNTPTNDLPACIEPLPT